MDERERLEQHLEAIERWRGEGVATWNDEQRAHEIRRRLAQLPAPTPPDTAEEP